MRPYKIDPELVKLKDELVEQIQEKMDKGEFAEDELPIVLAVILSLGYFHEFFRCAEVISNQLAMRR